MKAYLIVTTINVPVIAQDYYKNFKKFNHLDEIGMIIIGDRKTPDQESFAICDKLKKKGFAALYFDIKKQENWMKKHPKLKEIMPYDNDSRRNIGFLIALERGCDFIISIDDDNYPTDKDFYGGHAIVGKTLMTPTVTADSGWFNPCSMLKFDKSCALYARGHPYSQRHKNEKLIIKKKQVPIGVNAGLWLNDPDVDAITRLSIPARGLSLKRKQMVLAKNCYAPINTQNTAIVRELIPAFYFVLMQGYVNHMPFARFGDIWTGWFLKKTADQLGFYVRFGTPLSNHQRNIHNLLHDLYLEYTSIRYNDALVEEIQSISAKGLTCTQVYWDVATNLNKQIKQSKIFPKEFKDYADKLYEHQQIWLEVVSKLI